MLVPPFPSLPPLPPVPVASSSLLALASPVRPEVVQTDSRQGSLSPLLVGLGALGLLLGGLFAIPTAARVRRGGTGDLPGPVLGEITFYPGTFFYKNRKVMAPEEAARLGKMWDAAEKRLAGSLLAPAPKPN